MTESVIITVQMEVDSTQYYMATQGFSGSNFYNPFVQSLPSIEWSGEGFLKTQAGQLILTNDPDNDDHPFAYSTNWNSLITNPDQQFKTSINPGEPGSDKTALWHGYAVVRSITEDAIEFDLFEFADYGILDTVGSGGDWPVSSLTAGNPTVLTIDNREMGGNTLEDWVSVGDNIVINNTFSPVIANTQYLVTAISGNSVSIDLDSTGATFATPRVVTNTFDSGSGTRCILTKVLSAPFAVFSIGSTLREVPRDRYFQDGFFGYYFFTYSSNTGQDTGTNFKIFLDGVDQTSNFQRSGKGSYRKNDGSAFDGLITIQTVTYYKTIFDLIDLNYTELNYPNSPKAPDADDSVKAGLHIEYTKNVNREEFLNYICKNTNYQFFIRYSSSGQGPFSTIIDKANVPTAQDLDNTQILNATYQFKNPVKSVSCDFKTFTESGSLATDNYSFNEQSKNLSVFNSDLPTGSEISVEQVHDQTGQQLNYLQAILDVEKKITISVTLDNINTSILPGDNLNFTREVDKITVNQLLVRKIQYDLNSQQTTFEGDGTITLIEKT